MITFSSIDYSEPGERRICGKDELVSCNTETKRLISFVHHRENIDVAFVNGYRRVSDWLINSDLLQSNKICDQLH